MAVLQGGGQACRDNAPDLVFVVPADFKGYVVVLVNDRQCPPLVRIGGSLVFWVDQAGRGCTATFPQGGTLHYFRYGAAKAMTVSGLGPDAEIWRATGVGTEDREGQARRYFMSFFVGTEAEFHAVEAHPPGLPRELYQRGR
jgi:hypothetical protein